MGEFQYKKKKKKDSSNYPVWCPWAVDFISMELLQEGLLHAACRYHESCQNLRSSLEFTEHSSIKKRLLTAPYCKALY